MTYHWRQHDLVVGLELIFASVLAERTQMELVQLYTDVRIFERAKLLLQLLRQQVVVSLQEVHVSVIEVVKQHHFDKSLCDIFATKLQVHARVLNAHAFLNTANGRLLRTYIDDTAARVTSSEGCCQTLLNEAYSLEAEVPEHLFEDGRHKHFFVKIRNDKDARSTLR